MLSQVIYPSFRNPRIEPLTGREQEVLFHVAEGLNSREIADMLFMIFGTVKLHIYVKLGVRNQVEAASHAQELSLL
jgi:LuxR family maltose regulon positive regulatory protein